MGRAATAPARQAAPPAPGRPQRAPARRRPAPPAPARRPAPRAPRPRVATRAAARVEAVEARLPTGLLDRLLRDRKWIGLVGVLLVGIVFLNVRLLVLDGGIARDAERTAELKRANATLRLRAARLGSTERIQRVAAGRGLVWPQPGRVRWLRPEARPDARQALARMTRPAPTTAGGVNVASTGAPPAGPARAQGAADPTAANGATPSTQGATSTPGATSTAGGTATPAATAPPAPTGPRPAGTTSAAPVAAQGAPDVASPAG